MNTESKENRLTERQKLHQFICKLILSLGLITILMSPFQKVGVAIFMFIYGCFILFIGVRGLKLGYSEHPRNVVEGVNDDQGT
jgi:hypothetical protein